MTRGEFEDEIRVRAGADAEFYKRLIADPKAVLGEIIDETVPTDLEIKILEETSNLIYLTLVQSERLIKIFESVSPIVSKSKKDGMTRGELEDRLREKARTDIAFYNNFVADPKAVFGEIIGTVPADIEIKVLEETSNLIYLTLPPKPVEVGGELSEDEMKIVTGGGFVFISKK